MSKSGESPDRDASGVERLIAQNILVALESVSASGHIPETPELNSVLSALEYFVPETLSEIHPEWQYKSLDGVFPLVAEKTGIRMMSIFGLASIISDQTYVPISVELQVCPHGSHVNWMTCNVGANEGKGMVRSPHGLQRNFNKLLYSLQGKKDLLDWSYMVTYGEKTDCDK